MGRSLRVSVGGYAYHVVNRANARIRIFERAGDYEAFEKVLQGAVERTGMRLAAYCVMPNHWHLVVWPRGDGELSTFVGWLTLTHTQRWHAHRGDSGSGHLYQGRFKSLMIQSDEHFLTVCRYVERNPVRAGLVDDVLKWKWSSLWRRTSGDADARGILCEWPVQRPEDWVDCLSGAEREDELEELRRCVARGQPFGGRSWVERVTTRFGLESAFRPRGRPRKNP